MNVPRASEPPATPQSPHDEQTVFRSLFGAYPDALLLVDLQGLIVMANPAAEQLFLYPAGGLAGLAVDALVPDAIRPRHAAYRESYGRAPRARPMGTQMDLVARRRDGSEVMVEIALSPLQDHGLPLVVAAIRDIGAYPRVRQALQRARYSDHLAQFGRFVVDEREAQALLDHAAEIAATALECDVVMVFLLEPDRLAVRVAAGIGNLAAEPHGAIIPFDPDSVPGLVITQGQPMKVEDYREERRFTVLPAYLEAGLRSGMAVPISDRRRTVGALSVRSRTRARFADDELRFLVALASLLATCLQRARSEDALNHAQRLESVGQLTGGIAHDFNNLLTIVQGNLQVLEELPALADDEHGQQLVAAAARAARRGAELTGKLLAFSRRQVLKPAAVDVAAMLASLADMLRRTLDQRIRIELDVVEPCPAVLVDPVQLESALLNIAINARDAMPEGGTLRFSARLCGRLSAELFDQFDEPAALQEGVVAISVSDTGRGMSDEVRERAFEPFFTTKETGRGTGLGLSSVYGFAKQSKGAITIDSILHVGTLLSLYIPCAPSGAAARSDSAPASEVMPPGLSLLLVEDDAEVRAVALQLLEGFSCEVTAVESGEQALAQLESPLAPGAAQPFDVMLSDIALGAGLRGTQLAARAQAAWPALAVILMSGFSTELLEADRDSPPQWELLRKPFTRDELARALARVVGGR